MKKILLSATILSCLAVPAHADALSFSFAEASYFETDVDDFDIEGDGYALKLSGEFSQRFFGFVEYTDQEFDLGVEADSLEYGIGYSHELNINTDVYGTVARAEAEIESGPLAVDDDGYAFGLGIRTLVLNERLELEGRLNYVDVGDSDESLTVAARWNMSRRWTLGVQAVLDDDATTVGVGLRYYLNQ